MMPPIDLYSTATLDKILKDVLDSAYPVKLVTISRDTLRKIQLEGQGLHDFTFSLVTPTGIIPVQVSDEVKGDNVLMEVDYPPADPDLE